MATTLLLLVVLVVVFFRTTTSEMRERLLQGAVTDVRSLRDATAKRSKALEPFRDALRARTPWPLATLALVALNATIFTLMASGNGAFGEPATLIGWGGNFGPRTTNGEWWRLVTSTFVHSGTFHFLIDIVALIQIGFLLERLVGSLAFIAVYIVAAIFAGLVGVSDSPVAVVVGASGAIFGLYGLLLASLIWSVRHRSDVTVPFMAVKRLWPAAALLTVYVVARDGVSIRVELVGLIAGLVCGVALAKGVSICKPPARRVGIATAITVVIAVASAVPLRGITDVRPEIARLVTVEGHTATTYQTAADRFKKGRMTAEALVQVIDRTIMPELQAEDARLKALVKVPQEQQALLADAQEYLRLRSESWRLRSEGLRKTSALTSRPAGQTERASPESMRLQAERQHTSNMITLGKAEGTERASLETLQRISPAARKQAPVE